MSEPKRAALYLRISTDESHQPWSLGAQQERLEAYAKSQGWTVARTYTDRASGATLERPELRRVVSDARLGRFDVLVVVRVDRLSRNLAQLASLAERLEEAGVTLVSATEPFDTANPTGRMLFQLLGSFAEFERAMIVDRITQGLERRARSGRWTSGRIPYGYRRTTGGALEPDPIQAPVVSEIFRLYTEERLGSPTIAQRLNARGERTRAGGRWQGNAIAAILGNRAYLGLVPWRGEHHPGDHEPLVEEGVFAAAGRILSERGEDPRLRRGNASDYLLSRLVRCGRCGSAYVGMQANGNGGRYEYYACPGRSRQGRDFCSNDHLPRRALETGVLGQLAILLAQTDLLKEAWEAAQAERRQSTPGIADELERVRTRMRGVEGRRRRYFQAFEEGALDAALC